MTYTTDNHPESDLLIELAIGDELQEEIKNTLTDHIDQCPSCSRYINEMKGISNALQEMPDFTVPKSLHRGITSEIKRKSSIMGNLFNFSLVNWYKNPLFLTLALSLFVLFLYIYMIFVLK